MSLSSRFNIVVFDENVWSELDVIPTTRFTFSDDDCGLEDFELNGVVAMIDNDFKGRAIAIADVYDNRTDVHNHCIYTLGDGVKNREFNMDSSPEKANMHFETDIEDVHGWFDYADFELSETERKNLSLVPEMEPAQNTEEGDNSEIDVKKELLFDEPCAVDKDGNRILKPFRSTVGSFTVEIKETGNGKTLEMFKNDENLFTVYDFEDALKSCEGLFDLMGIACDYQERFEIADDDMPSGFVDCLMEAIGDVWEIEFF